MNIKLSTLFLISCVVFQTMNLVSVDNASQDKSFEMGALTQRLREVQEKIRLLEAEQAELLARKSQHTENKSSGQSALELLRVPSTSRPVGRTSGFEGSY